jgi:hypothetical protein
MAQSVGPYTVGFLTIVDELYVKGNDHGTTRRASTTRQIY